jgi:hypothetical protein
MADHSQNYIDNLAKELRNTASHYCKLFRIAHGLSTDQDRILEYIENENSYEDVEPDLNELLQEAEEALPETRNFRTNREEELYRFFRKHGKIPEIPEDTSWREEYSERDTVDHERVDDPDKIDYRPLIRATMDLRTFLMAASEFDEELERMLPEIEGDDAEIIESTSEVREKEVQPNTVSSHLEEPPEEADTNTYFFYGEIESENSDK